MKHQSNKIIKIHCHVMVALHDTHSFCGQCSLSELLKQKFPIKHLSIDVSQLAQDRLFPFLCEFQFIYV